MQARAAHASLLPCCMLQPLTGHPTAPPTQQAPRLPSLMARQATNLHHDRMLLLLPPPLLRRRLLPLPGCTPPERLGPLGLLRNHAACLAHAAAHLDPLLLALAGCHLLGICEREEQERASPGAEGAQQARPGGHRAGRQDSSCSEGGCGARSAARNAAALPALEARRCSGSETCPPASNLSPAIMQPPVGTACCPGR